MRFLTVKSPVLMSMLITSLVGFGAREASAAPTLQIYLEGGLYDHATESWYLAPPGSSAGEPFRLWVIGDTSRGPIRDVRLSMAYSASYRTDSVDLSVTLTPAQTNGLFGFIDPSIPEDPVLLQYGTEGTQPVLGDGRPLPAHGVFGPGVVWQEWLLGDFAHSDSPIGDFIGGVPPAGPKYGEIKVYEVRITFSNGTSAHGVQVHFDTYNHIEANNHAFYRFAPFSHDAEGDVSVVPEPTSLVGLLGLLTTACGFGGWSVVRRSRRR